MQTKLAFEFCDTNLRRVLVVYNLLNLQEEVEASICKKTHLLIRR